MSDYKTTQNCALLDALRTQTKHVHEALHHHSHFVALFDQTITRAQYADLMTRFYGYYAALEPAIERALQSGTGYTYDNRAGLIADDVTWLGQSVGQIPLCPLPQHRITPASIAGVLYVIEGSTLGAAQIDRAAQKLFGACTDDGRSFWAWSRAHNAQRWRMTLHYLTHFEGTDPAPILDGANATFEMLVHWLDPLDTQTATPTVLAS